MDSLNAAQKNVSDVTISNIPILISANDDVFPNKEEIVVRINYIYWRTCPMLAQISGKKFHPLSLLDLFNEAENFYEEDICLYGEKYETINKDDN